MIPLIKQATTTWNLEWARGDDSYNPPDVLGTKDEIGMWEFSGLMKNTLEPMFDPHPFATSNETFNQHIHSALTSLLRGGAFRKIQEGDQIVVNNPNPNGPSPRFSVEMQEKQLLNGKTVMVRVLTPLS